MADNNMIYAMWVFLPLILLWFLYRGERASRAAFLIRVGLLVLLAIVAMVFYFSYGRLKTTSGQNLGNYNADPLGTMKKYPLRHGMLPEEVIKLWGLPQRTSIEKSGSDKEGGAYTSKKARRGYSYIGPLKERWLYSRKEACGGWRIGKYFMIPSFSDWEDFYVVELIFWNGRLFDSKPKIEIINQGMVPRLRDANK